MTEILEDIPEHRSETSYARISPLLDRPPDERDNAEVRIAAGEYPIDKELDIL